MIPKRKETQIIGMSEDADLENQKHIAINMYVYHFPRSFPDLRKKMKVVNKYVLKKTLSRLKNIISLPAEVSPSPVCLNLKLKLI